MTAAAAGALGSAGPAPTAETLRAALQAKIAARVEARVEARLHAEWGLYANQCGVRVRILGG